MTLMLLLLGLVAVGATITISKSYRMGGKTFSENTSLDSVGVISAEKALAAAKTGTLTVRTDNDTGSITAQAGHGITTGQRLDVYWAGGSRRGMVVGTVATNVVPIDLGAGDNLPIATTPLTIMVPTEVDFGVTGNNAQAIMYAGEAPSTIVLTDGSTVEVDSKVFLAAGAFEWHTGSGVVNPLAGDTVAKCFLSHGDSTRTRTVKAAIGVN